MRLLDLKQVMGPESVNQSVRERLLMPETKKDLRQERDEAQLGEASARADAEAAFYAALEAIPMAA